MFDVIDCGYEEGHFKLGQTVYHIVDKIHRFSFHKHCTYCENSGKVIIKDKEFKCPSCNGVLEHKQVIEMVLDDRKNKIESIKTFKNKNESFETYATDSNGCGILIQKCRDGFNRYFHSEEEAQAVCDEYNRKNNVYVLLNEYQRRKSIEESGRKVAKWLYWEGWCGNHDQRIDDAKCSVCGYKHPTVYKDPNNLSDYCGGCGAKMIKE